MKIQHLLILSILIALLLSACNDVSPGQSGSYQIMQNNPGDPALLQTVSAPARLAFAQETTIPINELVFEGQAFAPAGADGMTILPEGLGQEADVLQSIYTSPVLDAPIPFNALVPEWIVDLPETSQLTLELRSGHSTEAMGEWVTVHPVEDWMQPDEATTVGDMLVVPDQDQTHALAQYRLTLTRETTAVEPLLRELRLVFIDSSAGPTTAEMIVAQQALNESLGLGTTLLPEADAANPKPFMISRDIWCTSPDCDYTDGLEYEPVTHLILHHTVSGASGDSAAIVRAIWAYHRSRGWDDIGYNYLVDTGGVLYEGHLGGEDVIGIHAAGANAGSMGLALIGTYSITTPPEPMLNSVVDMFSWKAEQRTIDVLDASNTLPNIAWGLPNLMGHRDVYGTTECPGDTAHLLLPEVRRRVAERIGLESAYLVTDELSSAFTKSNNSWSVAQLQCGHDSHAWYALSTTSAANATYWGEWRPAVPENGRYEIQAYAPYCNTGRPETEGAKYTITHMDGTTTVTINQEDRVGLWTSLGEYTLGAGNESVIRLTNLTTTDSGAGVWFDALRLRPLEALPGATLQSPADGAALTDRDITFTWQIENPDKVKATILMVATDAQFQNRIINDVWASPVLSAAHTLDQDYSELFWRVIVTSAANNEYASEINRFTVDTGPPVSTVGPLYRLTFSERYLVAWSGTDSGSGIAAYTIEYRPVGAEDGAWRLWLENVAGTSALFIPPDPATEYEFRSRATDALGNMEAAHETADITTAQAIPLDHMAVLPIIIKK